MAIIGDNGWQDRACVTSGYRYICQNVIGGKNNIIEYSNDNLNYIYIYNENISIEKIVCLELQIDKNSTSPPVEK